MILGFFLRLGQDCFAKSPAEKGETLKDDENPAYLEAYTEFLLDEDINQGQDFPIRGYYLLDLNFDGTPELGILHDSWGVDGRVFHLLLFRRRENYRDFRRKRGTGKNL